MDKLIVLGNGYEWCEAALRRLIKSKNVKFFNCLPVNEGVLSGICRILLSDKAQKYIPNIVRWPIYKIIVKNMQLDQKNESDEIKIVIYDGNRLGNQIGFFKYLRRHFRYIYLVYLFTNITKITEASGRGYLNYLNEWYDVVFAFDPEDAKKYNFSYSPLIYDADESYIRQSNESKEDLVFYVGQAKDRLSGLLNCFEKLKELDIKTDFHIANVSEQDIKYAGEITYNKFMTYDHAVDSIQKATCLIDVIQGDSTGLTIKTCEAVCYDKKLITTNAHVKEYPFYDPRYIRVIESADDIDEAFFKENTDVHYSEEGKRYFSAESFMKRLDKELERRG